MKTPVFIFVLFLLGCGTNEQVEPDQRIALLEMQLDSLQLDYSARIGMLIFELDTLKSRVAKHDFVLRGILEENIDAANWHIEFGTQYFDHVDIEQKFRDKLQDHYNKHTH